MKRRPAILIAPGTVREGAEFSDASVSLSHCYARAVIAAGGLPHIFAATTNRPVITEFSERCDGVLMTGGEDIDSKLYTKKLAAEAAEWKEPGRQPFLLPVQFHPERLIDRNPLFLRIFSSFVAACEQRQQRNL